MRLGRAVDQLLEDVPRQKTYQTTTINAKNILDDASVDLFFDFDEWPLPLRTFVFEYTPGHPHVWKYLRMSDDINIPLKKRIHSDGSVKYEITVQASTKRYASHLVNRAI